ncbi:hypothetical protein BIZ95_gp81 [Pseudomonas phage vB_PaeP_MAG4]|uniref:Uncharacterized protein n=1 Tax=Pseudomonas phage vB_PaeP_MAG4 TaxID=1639814 RepID=A0A172B2N9_9CAUD|nr:hypothetical protein BIZ95_gp81 [Pseudomonas phage vB_PaeP_MAG4]AKH49524.1 hypothetical protein vB_PaeP_fi6_081 [Pseudomonas phage vB_PaeP_MAG4]
MADFLEMSDDDLPEFYEVEEQTRSDQEEHEQGQQDDVQLEEVVQEEEEPADEEQEEEQDPLNSPDDELGDLPVEEKPTTRKSRKKLRLKKNLKPRSPRLPSKR